MASRFTLSGLLAPGVYPQGGCSLLSAIGWSTSWRHPRCAGAGAGLIEGEGLKLPLLPRGRAFNFRVASSLLLFSSSSTLDATLSLVFPGMGLPDGLLMGVLLLASFAASAALASIKMSASILLFSSFAGSKIGAGWDTPTWNSVCSTNLKQGTCCTLHLIRCLSNTFLLHILSSVVIDILLSRHDVQHSSGLAHQSPQWCPQVSQGQQVVYTHKVRRPTTWLA